VGRYAARRPGRLTSGCGRRRERPRSNSAVAALGGTSDPANREDAGSVSKRRDFAFACRIYRSEAGASEQPEESWVRDALIEAAK
jgi:hypothetical protein